MNGAILSEPTRGFWIISGLALIWNLLGVMAYLMQVMMTPEALAAMGEAERALYADMPSWVTGAYAVAVFGGALGCIALLLRKAWSIPLFVVSLVGILLQMGYTLVVANTIEVMGAGIIVMPLFIILVAIYLIMFSRSSKAQGYFT